MKRKVIKEQHAYRKYQHLVLGIIWLVVSFVYFLNDEPISFLIFGYFFVAIGEISLQLYYKKKGRVEESISWDNDLVIVQELFQEPQMYPLEQIDSIALTQNNFIIKSGAAKGVMMELKGFSKEDIDLLRNDLCQKFSPAFQINSNFSFYSKMER
jgi:hypothetical protein